MYALHVGKLCVQYGVDHLCGEGDSVPLDGCVIRLHEGSISMVLFSETIELTLIGSRSSMISFGTGHLQRLINRLKEA